MKPDEKCRECFMHICGYCLTEVIIIAELQASREAPITIHYVTGEQCQFFRHSANMLTRSIG